jgi:hypothetical protein
MNIFSNYHRKFKKRHCNGKILKIRNDINIRCLSYYLLFIVFEILELESALKILLGFPRVVYI